MGNDEKLKFPKTNGICSHGRWKIFNIYFFYTGMDEKIEAYLKYSTF